VYGQALATMLTELEQMNALMGTEASDVTGNASRAERKFLDILTGWGTTNFVQEYVRLCKYDDKGRGGEAATVCDAEERFAFRYTQSSAGYLKFPVPVEESEYTGGGSRIRSDCYHEAKESLYDIDEVAKTVSRSAKFDSGVETDAMKSKNTPVALDALARLNMMRGQYDAALKCFLLIGALHSARPLEEFDAAAAEFSDLEGKREIDRPWQPKDGAPYTYVLDVVDSHNLHQFLLDDQFLSVSGSKEVAPLFPLLQLVGFVEMGKFLVEHCVPPQLKQKKRQDGVEERIGTLPLDRVADQMKQRPRILHWYLHLIFDKKPEVYVRFPNTAYPPPAVTDLHRLHFDFCVQFSGRERDSAWFCSQVETYKVINLFTRLLEFLKVCTLFIWHGR
jgi:vacuolar protein sorting-associated protein 41